MKVQATVVVPVYGHAALTRQCLDVLLRERKGNAAIEIVVVDDASRDHTAEILDGYGDRIRVVRHDDNLGFAHSCNDGAEAANGELLVFLNNDTIPQPGWLEALLDYTRAHPDADVVGAKLLFPDDTVQHAGVVIDQYGYPKNVYVGFPAWHPAVNQSRRFQAVTGACMLVRGEAFEAVGGFDTAYRNGLEDVDFCFRLHAIGGEAHYCHESVVYHLESMSEGRFDDSNQNREVYERRWLDSVQPDDFRYYAADGLIGIRYEDIYPLRIDLSPQLGVVEGDELGRRADSLLGVRSRRSFELMKEVERLNVQLLEAEGHHAELTPRLLEEGTARWQSASPARPFVSVLLPVRDGREWLATALSKLDEQDVPAVIGAVGVDCGSSDGSVETMRENEARIVAVDALSAAHAPLDAVLPYVRGDVVVVLGQGSVPANGDWLAALLAALEDGADAACSRLLPIEGAGGLYERELLQRPAARPDRIHALSSPDADRFHAMATAFRAEALAKIPLATPSTANVERWVHAALEAGLTLAFESAAVALETPPSHREVLRTSLAEAASARANGNGNGNGHHDELDAAIGAIREDWRLLETARGLTEDELEQARIDAALRRALAAVGVSLARTGEAKSVTRSRAWIEDARAGLLGRRETERT